mmetsp:Transcript_23678/g.77069  ORF Transcript_23678/g.77069 Transcript_23678/m.77069 type:complete len:226 (-) Transcript_23678:933-1610(-)
MSLLQLLQMILHRDDLLLPPVKVSQQLVVPDQTSFSSQLLVLAPQVVAVMLRLRQRVPVGRQVGLQLCELHLEKLVLSLNELKFLLEVRQDLDGRCCLLAQLQQLLVPLLDLLVQRLVLDLQLLEVDEVELVGKLLLPLQVPLQLSQLVSQVDVLQPDFFQLSVLLIPLFFQLVQQLERNGPPSRASDALCDLSFRLLELLFEVLNLLLLLLQSCLHVQHRVIII